MTQDDSDVPSIVPQAISSRLKAAMSEGTENVRNVIGAAVAGGARVYAKATGAADNTFNTVQKTLGEDYHAILQANPLITGTLAQGPLFTEKNELLTTVFNTSWLTVLLWTAATGTASVMRRPIGHGLGNLCHYGPGHSAQWEEVNRFMDSVAGSGHRLKFGHSIDFLPDIIEKFGMEGVPAYVTHLAQDFTTVDGLPILPNAWNIKQTLMISGIAPKTATMLVSISASQILVGLSLAYTLRKIYTTIERERRKRTYLKTADSALENGDFSAAVESYKKALEVERTPETLMALGEVYLRRRATRPHAYRAFTDAMQILASDPSRVIPYAQARVSLRGLAGLQSLGTSDVVGDRYPEYWQEHIETLVNGTVHSFSAAATHLEAQRDHVIKGKLAAPALVSAAINRFLAAKAACQYPLLDNRREIVTNNLLAALRCLGQVAHSDETTLRSQIDILRQSWTRAVLPEDEAESLLATA